MALVRKIHPFPELWFHVQVNPHEIEVDNVLFQESVTFSQLLNLAYWNKHASSCLSKEDQIKPAMKILPFFAGIQHFQTTQLLTTKAFKNLTKNNHAQYLGNASTTVPICNDLYPSTVVVANIGVMALAMSLSSSRSDCFLSVLFDFAMAIENTLAISVVC